MERLGKIKVDYVKPVTSRFEMDKNICDDMCGMLGAIVTSTKSFQQFQICVHFPVEKNGGSNNGKTHYYTSGGGSSSVRKITIKGKHIIEFAGSPAYVDCDYRPNDWYTYGCGWKEYDTTNNGDCHYFGVVKVDGFEITRYGDLPAGVTAGW